MPKTNIVGQIVSEILAQFVWSHQNITGLISQRQFTLQWQVGLLGVFLSECPDEFNLYDVTIEYSISVSCLVFFKAVTRGVGDVSYKR